MTRTNRTCRFLPLFFLLLACNRVPVEQLITQLQDRDPVVQDQAARQLVKRKDKAVPALSGLLDKEDETHKIMALQVLSKINTPSAGQAVLKALGDINLDVRLQAALVLASVPLPDQVPPPILKAIKDPYWKVRLGMVQVLSRFKTQPALAAIAALLEDKNDEVRKNAIQALLLIQNPAVVRVLLKALDNQDAQVRYIAIQALGTLQDTSAIKPLLKILAEEANTHLKQKAALSLGMLKSKKAVPLLQEMARTDDPDEKKAALQALGMVKQTP